MIYDRRDGDFSQWAFHVDFFFVSSIFLCRSLRIQLHPKIYLYASSEENKVKNSFYMSSTSIDRLHLRILIWYFSFTDIFIYYIIFRIIPIT